MAVSAQQAFAEDGAFDVEHVAHIVLPGSANYE
jgi:hypothetical protein